MLYMTGIFYVTFFGHDWPQVSKTMAGKTLAKEYCCLPHCTDRCHIRNAQRIRTKGREEHPDCTLVFSACMHQHGVVRGVVAGQLRNCLGIIIMQL